MDGGDAGVAIGGMICGLIIGTAIAAVFILAAVAIFNGLAGGARSEGAVPEPAFGKAMGIAFVTWLVQTAVQFILDLAGAAGAGGGQPTAKAQLLLLAMSLPISFLTSAGMLAAMLPTSFLKGLAVAFIQFVLILLIIAVLFGGLYAMGSLTL